jgi:hypothetical protein
MYTAMYVRKTRPGAADSVQKAIDSLSSEKHKAYLRNNWLNSIDSWAMCARSHVCLLLQVWTPSALRIWLFITFFLTTFTGFDH